MRSGWSCQSQSFCLLQRLPVLKIIVSSLCFQDSCTLCRVQRYSSCPQSERKPASRLTQNCELYIYRFHDRIRFVPPMDQMRHQFWECRQVCLALAHWVSQSCCTRNNMPGIWTEYCGAFLSFQYRFAYLKLRRFSVKYFILHQFVFSNETLFHHKISLWLLQYLISLYCFLSFNW